MKVKYCSCGARLKKYQRKCITCRLAERRFRKEQKQLAKELTADLYCRRPNPFIQQLKETLKADNRP